MINLNLVRTHPPSVNFFEQFPDEIILDIMKRLSLHEQIAFGTTCQRCYRILHDKTVLYEKMKEGIDSFRNYTYFKVYLGPDYLHREISNIRGNDTTLFNKTICNIAMTVFEMLSTNNNYYFSDTKQMLITWRNLKDGRKIDDPIVCDVLRKVSQSHLDVLRKNFPPGLKRFSFSEITLGMVEKIIEENLSDSNTQINYELWDGDFKILQDPFSEIWSLLPSSKLTAKKPSSTPLNRKIFLKISSFFSR